MKKLKVILISLICMVTTFMNIFAQDLNDVNSQISADGYVLMDAVSKRILVSRNEDTRYYPASTTKILTAILVLENEKDLKTKITIGREPTLVEPSSINLVEGEVLDVESLLYATLLQSANDAAEALGEYIGGSKEGFAVLMNEKAKSLGCNDSNFVNASGLHDDNHYTTPKDLANILSYAVNNERFLEISETSQYLIEATNLHQARMLKNQIEYDPSKGSASYYEKAICAKTGYTDQASHTFAGASKFEDTILVAAFLHDENRNFNEYKKNLFEFGFKHIE